MTIAFAIGRAIGKGLFPITDEKMMAAAKKGEEKRRLKAEKKAKKRYILFIRTETNEAFSVELKTSPRVFPTTLSSIHQKT